MKNVFLAFPGWEVQLKSKISKINDFEFWNLDKIKQDEFINLIQEKIKPLNKNVKRNYYSFGGYEKFCTSYKDSNWGMLLPDYEGEFYGNEHDSILLIKLFSGLPLHIMFTVGKGGIFVKKDNITELEKSHWHKEDLKFKNKKFVDFYNELHPIVINTDWHADKVFKWSREEWRLNIAFSQFEELFKYFRSKYPMNWQSECSDIVSLYEILLSRKKNDNGQYKIIQRIEILLSDFYGKKMPTIKKELKKLYNFRNDFVHGSYFDHLKKETKFYSDDKNMAQAPSVDFEFLERQFNIARKVFIAYLFLIKKLKDKKLQKCKNKSISEIITDGIMNIEKRTLIQKYSKEILKLSI